MLRKLVVVDAAEALEDLVSLHPEVKMASARAALRLVGDTVWYLGWASLALGALLLLVGRQPSPGSEWNAAAAGGLVLIPLGVLGLLLGGVLRLAFRPRKEGTPTDPGLIDSHGTGSAPRR